ncbi:hypothetical protein GHR37_19240 [Achromobacter xylosoxidans]|nr:hypothetical protein [Achromobacter xylosoxidans]
MQKSCPGVGNAIGLAAQGDLEKVKIGDATQITVASVQALIERSKQKKAA